MSLARRTGLAATMWAALACTGTRRRVVVDSANDESLPSGGSAGVWRRVAMTLGIGSPDTAPPPYTGTGPEGIPRYAQRPFSDAERSLLRRVYGIEDPGRLYVSDSSEDGLLKYDTTPKRCRTCYVNSYRVGFESLRRTGESWEQLERRVRAMRSDDFPTSARTESRSTAALDPAVRADAERMLADARSAGFALRVVATYRSPEREAYIMWRGRGRTHTLTSMHSYGRALDVVVGDGNLGHQATRERWIAFRRWVSHYRAGEFHIIGSPERTWDWPHIEIPSPGLGFRTIGAALARARACAPNGEPTATCDFAPRLPPGE